MIFIVAYPYICGSDPCVEVATELGKVVYSLIIMLVTARNVILSLCHVEAVSQAYHRLITDN